MKIKQFIKNNKITMTYKVVGHNPNIIKDQWSNNSTHLKCLLKTPKKQMTIYFSQGPLCDEVTAEDVLDCLAMDSYTVENHLSLDEFMSEYGYTSCKDAKQVRDAIYKNYNKVLKFLGRQQFDILINEVERL